MQIKFRWLFFTLYEKKIERFLSPSHCAVKQLNDNLKSLYLSAKVLINF